MRLTQTIKGYRPSRFGEAAEPTMEALRAKERTIEAYARLVRKGFVLFENTPSSAKAADRQEEWAL
jgi:hypothetical protein